VKRSAFLQLAAAAPLLAAARPAIAAGEDRHDLSIPVEMRGGRLFAVPQTPDGRTFACWLDTDGDGFIFDSAVERFALSASQQGMGRTAPLPAFAPAHGIPPLVNAKTLPVFDRSPSDRNDPILQGFDAQLGATWFAGRIWRCDFGRGALTMLAQPLPASSNTIPLRFRGPFPRVDVSLGESRSVLTMSLDIAASVAYRPGFASGVEVQAASFIPHATLEQLHAEHPDWRVDRDVSPTSGVDRIVVPQVRVGAQRFANVAFTTRPQDDVFQGDSVTGKLGANAYAGLIVTIDYPSAQLQFE
jgi:hypothetical protein